MKALTPAVALAAWILGLMACASAPPPQPEPPPAPVGVTSSPPAPVASSPPLPSGEAEPQHTCHLPAAKKSDDACKTDADCGPSDPCHAKACVARAKSKPRTPDQVCTMMMGCDTDDANRCGCLEGRCALIPPA